jgi:hypothetical protein
MKKRNPSSGQNGQLVHWWLLIHSGRGLLIAIHWTNHYDGPIRSTEHQLDLFGTLVSAGAERCCAIHQPWQLAQLCVAKTIFLSQTVVRNYFKYQEEGKK